MRLLPPLVAMLVMAVPMAAHAQLGLPVPDLPNPDLPVVGGVLDRAGNILGDAADQIADLPAELLRQRELRLDRLIRRNRQALERDANGAPARRGILLAMDASPADLARANAAGYRIADRAPLEGLGISVATLRLPDGMSLEEGERQLRAIMPGATITADNIHLPAGSIAAAPDARRAETGAQIAEPVGVIDGAPGKGAAPVAMRRFAGKAVADDHASAMLSLLSGAGVTHVHAADVFGGDPAGGGALAIAQALGWLAKNKVRVVTISLVGPANPLLERSVRAAQARGMVITAAIGNDGPSAPLSYPASYPGVLAATGVDGRRRALIEASIATAPDYAAPGADIRAANAKGRRVKLRGTSYASPLVAARVAAALEYGRDPRRFLDAEAMDLGEKGPDPIYGRGLVCGGCAR